MPLLSRRRFVGTTAGFAASRFATTFGMEGTPLATPVGSSSAADKVPAGYMDRATEPADLSVDQNYSTERMPIQEFAEDCQFQLYPWAVNCESARSYVFVSKDLNSEPNRVLIQRLKYPTLNFVETSFDRIATNALDIFGATSLTKPEAHPSDDPDKQKRRFQLTAMNGWSKALHVERRELAIGIVRAGSRSGPPWDALGKWISQAFADLEDVDSLSIEGAEWHLSYGPFDFHPSVYENPTCG